MDGWMKTAIVFGLIACGLKFVSLFITLLEAFP